MEGLVRQKVHSTTKNYTQAEAIISLNTGTDYRHLPTELPVRSNDSPGKFAEKDILLKCCMCKTLRLQGPGLPSPYVAKDEFGVPTSRKLRGVQASPRAPRSEGCFAGLHNKGI